MNARQHFLLTALGSAGDLVPMLTLGQTLQARGHRVTVLTTGGFDDLVAASGLTSAPWLPCGFPERSLRDVPLLGTRHHALFFKRHAVAWNAALLRFFSAHREEKPVLVSAERPLLWADLCAHLHFGFPCVRLVVDPPPAPGLAGPAAPASSRSHSSLSFGWQSDWTRAARRQGLGAGFNHVARLTRATQRSVPRIALWPEWLAPRAPRAANLRNLGFIAGPSLESARPFRRPGGGRPLLVFLSGSVGTTRDWEPRFAAVSREICARLDCDGLLLGGSRPADGVEAPFFRWDKHVPLDAVLPSAAALIHHGGIGTAATALRHGVPQLIVPRMFSQPSTAEWMRRLGVAGVLPPAEYEAGLATSRIREIMATSSYRQLSLACADRIDAPLDLNRLSAFVEELAPSKVSHPRFQSHALSAS